MNYYVIEYRGCEINYPMYCSTQKGCEQWLKDNTIAHPLNDEIRISPDKLTNGNGDYFTYAIKEIVED